MSARTVKFRRGSVKRVTHSFTTPGVVQALLRQLRPLANDCQGSLLLETVVAVMVFSMVGTAVITGLNTAYTAGAKVESQSVAENVARNQMEYIFNETYRAPGETPYPTIIVPPGYTVSAAMEDIDPQNPDPDIEKLTVTVSHDGQDILVLTGLRFNDN